MCGVRNVQTFETTVEQLDCQRNSTDCSTGHCDRVRHSKFPATGYVSSTFSYGTTIEVERSWLGRMAI